MNINIGNIPKAIMYFFVGAVINIVMYYIFSPSQANLFAILAGIAGDSLDAKTLGILWGVILIVAILINIAYPLFIIFDEEDGTPDEE